MAACLLQHSLIPPIACLRSMNPYVASTVADWDSTGLQAAIPRQLAPGTGILPGLCVGGSILHFTWLICTAQHHQGQSICRKREGHI